MIDILCMILSVIKLFIYIVAFHFKSIKRTINLTERKTERWTSRRLHILIKKGKKKHETSTQSHYDIVLCFNSGTGSFYCDLERGALPKKIDRKVHFNGCSIVFVNNCGE